MARYYINKLDELWQLPKRQSVLEKLKENDPILHFIAIPQTNGTAFLLTAIGYCRIDLNNQPRIGRIKFFEVGQNINIEPQKLLVKPLNVIIDVVSVETNCYENYVDFLIDGENIKWEGNIAFVFGMECKHHFSGSEVYNALKDYLLMDENRFLTLWNEKTKNLVLVFQEKRDRYLFKTSENLNAALISYKTVMGLNRNIYHSYLVF